MDGIFFDTDSALIIPRNSESSGSSIPDFILPLNKETFIIA